MPKYMVKKFEVYEMVVAVEANNAEEVEFRIEEGDYVYMEDHKYVGDLPGATLQLVEEIGDGVPK
jgi:hypothetical protein